MTPATGTTSLRSAGTLALAFALSLALSAGSALAAQQEHGAGHFCSRTAVAQFVACNSELRDDLFIAAAICLNLSDAEEREECYDEAAEERAEASELCREQRAARLELCGALGEDRYDPDFDPADFDDDFTSLTNPNPYFPLDIGNRWVYEGGDETITVEVLDATKLIEGVTCIVVNDVVEDDGEVIEDTDDWYGQRIDGTVDYCGEIARDFETFDGDDPETPELVEIEGSFKAGRDGDKAGTRFPASPAAGDLYRQEWSPSNAEDVALVLSTTYGYGGDPELDAYVPQALAELLCDDDCVVTLELTPIEPDAFERKYHAPGIGTFLEVDPDSGDIVQLVDCNFDPRCALLPAP